MTGDGSYLQCSWHHRLRSLRIVRTLLPLAVVLIVIVGLC